MALEANIRFGRPNKRVLNSPDLTRLAFVFTPLTPPRGRTKQMQSDISGLYIENKKAGDEITG